jgi:hypothetical protein
MFEERYLARCLYGWLCGVAEEFWLLLGGRFRRLGYWLLVCSCSVCSCSPVLVCAHVTKYMSEGWWLLLLLLLLELFPALGWLGEGLMGCAGCLAQSLSFLHFGVSRNGSFLLTSARLSSCMHNTFSLSSLGDRNHHEPITTASSASSSPPGCAPVQLCTPATRTHAHTQAVQLLHLSRSIHPDIHTTLIHLLCPANQQ